MNLREQTKHFISISQNLLEFNKNIIINKYKNNSNINNDQIENIINWLENNKQYFKDKHALWLTDFIINNNYYKNLKANENDLYQLLNFTKYIDKYNFKKEKYKTINDINNETNKIKQKEETKKTQRDIQNVKIDKFNNYTIYKLTNKDIDLITKLSKFGHKYGIPPKFDIPTDAQYFSDWCTKNEDQAKSYSNKADYLYIIIDPEGYPFIAMDDANELIMNKNDAEIQYNNKESKFLSDYISSNNHIIEKEMLPIIAIYIDDVKLMQKYLEHFKYSKYKNYRIYKLKNNKYKIIDSNNNLFIDINGYDIFNENGQDIEDWQFNFLFDYLENSNDIIFDDNTIKDIISQSFYMRVEIPINILMNYNYDYDEYENYLIYKIDNKKYMIYNDDHQQWIKINDSIIEVYDTVYLNKVDYLTINSNAAQFLRNYLENNDHVIFTNEIKQKIRNKIY